MLERSAVKVARCVLRGERSREAPDLPGDCYLEPTGQDFSALKTWDYEAWTKEYAVMNFASWDYRDVTLFFRRRAPASLLMVSWKAAWK